MSSNMNTTPSSPRASTTSAPPAYTDSNNTPSDSKKSLINIFTRRISSDSSRSSIDLVPKKTSPKKSSKKTVPRNIEFHEAAATYMSLR